jgi:4-diphosphocytidyl-2C-methyl-D-erythritol kinase
VTPASRPTVIAKAPAKINLILRVGAPDDSGYHPLVTVFQAVDLWDEVAVSSADSDRLVVSGSVDVSGVPTDQTNIVWKAVDALSSVRGNREPLTITITKRIPVAGGMAGGSADAAATLVALNELWGLGLAPRELADIGATLGADVPFSLRGGLALGEGRGDILTPLDRQQLVHVVAVISALALSTPKVYQTLDERRQGGGGILEPLSDGELAGVTGNDVTELIGVLTNDLQPATISLAPTVQANLDALGEAGALASLVSGSGPTVFGLCRDATHATQVAHAVRVKGLHAIDTVSTSQGAHLISSLSSLSSPREGH